jgi:hypothetical protein
MYKYIAHRTYGCSDSIGYAMLLDNYQPRGPIFETLNHSNGITISQIHDVGINKHIVNKYFPRGKNARFIGYRQVDETYNPSLDSNYLSSPLFID